MKTVQIVLAETLRDVFHFSIRESISSSMEILDILKSEKIKIPKDAPFQDIKPHEKMPDKLVYYTDSKTKKVGEMSFSKLMTKIVSLDPDVKPNDVNKIVIRITDKFKNKFRPENLFKFEEWKKVSDAYKSSNHISSGTLKESCMNNKPYLKMYDDHKNISVVVMLNEDGKIVGRALLWKDILLGGSKVTFMDRIYTSKNEYEVPMKEYAGKNGWFNRKVQSYTEKEQLEKNGSGKSGQLLFYIPLDEYNTHPYMDTMSHACYDTDKKEFCLSNVSVDKLN